MNRRSVAILVVWLSLVSCSSDATKGTTGGLDGGLDGGPPIGNFVQVSSTVIEVKAGAPIANARICIVDRPEIPCATSAADGSYTLSIPAWTTPVDIAFNVTAARHLGSTGLVHEKPGSVVWLSHPLYDDAGAAELMNHAGFTYPGGGKGYVLLAMFRGSGGAAQGLTATSAPAGLGPVYLDPVGTPNPALTAVTSNGYALFGGLEPGPIEITVSDTCVPLPFTTQGWVSAKPHTIAGTTAADSLTTMVVICE
jgi:hypothetical protein